jgi:peptidoglycan/xylan/chitin deacetylase (PgdA/CDA1 family)
MISQYSPPLLISLSLLLLVVGVLWLGRKGKLRRTWQALSDYWLMWGIVALLILVSVAVTTFLVSLRHAEEVKAGEAYSIETLHNLLPIQPNSVGVTDEIRGWTTSGAVTFSGYAPHRGFLARLAPGAVITSSLVPVEQGASYRYSLYAQPRDSIEEGEASGQVQMRVIWYAKGHTAVTWYDTPVWEVAWKLSGIVEFYTDHLIAPTGATLAQVVIRSLGPGAVRVDGLKFSPLGLHIEPNPNGTQGSLAFSFDWESAMGGAIHSKGMKEHEASAAAEHGLEMRQGADWLNRLFSDNNIRATFYATGYNLLDGNVERRIFAGDPVYKWAAPKNRWDTDWWLTHRWYSDDPYGTYQSRPAWYFGDQTRRLLDARHEIASHTFGHLYVRGSNPDELATDMDEWLSAAHAIGITTTTTFAFPWRSSNSLTADFYDVLYKRGIRAVTRIYERDMKDFYTIGAVPVYPNIAVMPDFLLGAPSINAGEEAQGGDVIGLDQGLMVITETLARRGTTSFWTHPEQLADAPAFAPVRDTWTKIVAEAASQRDKGKLWIATVADITAYQRDVMSVTTSLDKGFLGMGGWKVQVRNDSGKELHGVTLTMPGDVQRVSSGVVLQTVQYAGDSTRLSEPGKPLYPARQIVLPNLPPGTTTLDVEWVAGQEPIQ